MGLGGHLTWTAVAREISQRAPDVKVLPCKNRSGIFEVVRCEVFKNNPYILQDSLADASYFLPMLLDNPAANYCKKDTPEKAFHNTEFHIIEQACQVYGIQKPELKCDIFLTEEEVLSVENSLINIPKEFVTIEPFSKTNYTPNRAYPFDKFQEVVNKLSKDVAVVQVGNTAAAKLDNAIDLRGNTTFREASGIIGKSKAFISCEGGLVHAATAFQTKSVVILTGYQSEKMVAYPQNININISTHGPCGLKIKCPTCTEDRNKHDCKEIIRAARSLL